MAGVEYAIAIISRIMCNSSFDFSDYPLGVWIDDAKYELIPNQKSGKNLKFNGYVYRKEANFKSSTNWVCAFGNGKRQNENKCAARCVTTEKGSIKLGKHKHNH